MATAGTRMNPVPRFSVAVMVYSSDFPVLTPTGILIAQAKTPAVAAQRHTEVTGLMPGPASVDLTLDRRAHV